MFKPSEVWDINSQERLTNMGVRSRIFLTIFLSLFFSVIATYFITERDLRRGIENQIVSELEKEANLIVENIGNVSSFLSIEESDAAADNLGSIIDSRVTLISNEGEVVGDSSLSIQEISLLDNHLNRLEVIEALKNKRGWSSRYSNTLDSNLLYFAVLDENTEEPNVIRVAVPLSSLDSALSSLDLAISLLFIVVFIVSVFASFISSRILYSNIEALDKAASRIIDGAIKKKDIKALPTQRVDEFGNVARTISQISADLKKRIQDIAKQRDQFGNVLNDLGEGILVADNDEYIFYSNEQSQIILELQKLNGRKLQSLNIPAINYLTERAKEKKKADIEFEIELKDKTTRWVLGSMNKSKSTGEFILVLHDISQLRQLNSMRRDFISNLSHELRTPVSVIRANSETLLSGALEDKKEATVFAKAIMHNSERLSEMVSDLIDLSRIEYGDLKLNIRSIDINQIIESIVFSMKSILKRKNISIKFEPHQTKSMVKADLNAIERIINNFIDNAYKYSPNNSSIQITTESSNNDIKINIIDEGDGITPKEMNLIFDRFFRTASARASEKSGSGLGLAIVKNLVNSLNGKVGVDSNEKGSTFWFTLPKSK
jgi:two-component system phosphate regulon sensor histidine kinase PhoR